MEANRVVSFEKGASYNGTVDSIINDVIGSQLLQTAHCVANTGVVEKVVLLWARMWGPRQVTHLFSVCDRFTSHGIATV